MEQLLTHPLEQSERALLALAQIYNDLVERSGGRSLARVATVVVNRGSFFTALRRGSTCSLRNFDKLMRYFSVSGNWPSNEIPPEAIQILASCGRTTQTQLEAAE